MYMSHQSFRHYLENPNWIVQQQLVRLVLLSQGWFSSLGHLSENINVTQVRRSSVSLLTVIFLKIYWYLLGGLGVFNIRSNELNRQIGRQTLSEKLLRRKRYRWKIYNSERIFPSNIFQYCLREYNFFVY